ncbi:hypothetical protein [Tenacibaculum xiamenense]|uniref:hypothetical protein n=1 Tax=Tenacibaculum xiamenense TaxID=1261553 RepID=UPI0038937ADE
MKLVNYKLQLLIPLLLFFITINAQKKKSFIPPSLEDNEIPVTKINLTLPKKGKDYEVKYLKGITTNKEHRIAIKKLGYILRPAMVQVVSEDGRELVVEMVKKNWDDVVKSNVTNNGVYIEQFKTAYEFGIKIKGIETGIPFIMAVSAGKELFNNNQLFVDTSILKKEKTLPVSEGAISKEKESNLLTIIIAIVLIGILIFLTIIVLKKKRSKVVVLLLYSCISYSQTSALKVITENVASRVIGNVEKQLNNFYKNGNFTNSPFLDKEDSDFEFKPPSGQPSLPSSCFDRLPQTGSQSLGRNTDVVNDREHEGNRSASGGSPREVDKKGVNREQVLQDIQRITTEHQKQLQDFEDQYMNNILEIKEDFQNQRQHLNDDVVTEKEKTDNEKVKESLSLEHAKQLEHLEIEEEKAIEANKNRYDSQVEKVTEEYNNTINELENLLRNDDESSNQEGSHRSYDSSERRIRNSNRHSQNTDEETLLDSKDKKNGCDCLEEAYKELKKNQLSLEKLLKIAQHTKKITDYGISFGDNFSGVHAVSGLAWQKERAKVLKSIEKFDRSYKNKHAELMKRLHTTLMTIDRCEKKLGEDHWYNKSGFMYYEFMKVRYASYK